MDLLAEARRLLEHPESGLTALLQRDLALMLAQFSRIQAQRIAAQTVLRYAITEVGTELAQMEAQRWWYQNDGHRLDRWRDQQRLRARRSTLETERIRIEGTFEQQTRALEDRLNATITRFRQLAP